MVGSSLPAAWPPDREAALATLASLDAKQYRATRNHLEGAVTRLSPAFTHGAVTTAEAIEGLLARGVARDDKIIFELAWREFFLHLHDHWGESIRTSRRPAIYEGEYHQSVPLDIVFGGTGIAVIDQAVANLYATGYLHNHARMWLASYLVHIRKVDWRFGADWMYATLLDGDHASNHLSWQWVAGTLTGKPYLFNAENVARYAPQEWWCPHSILDTSYARLEQLARQAADDSPPLNATRLTPPATLGGAAVAALVESARRSHGEPVADFTGQDIVILHPWCLRPLQSTAAACGARPVLVLLTEFHDEYRWTQVRWDYCLRLARQCSATVLVGTKEIVSQHLRSVHSMTAEATPNLIYREWIANLSRLGPATRVLPRPRFFDHPARAMPSFSAFWNAVNRKLSKKS
jgi:deoxyribodipyrimidine photo-lyase